MATVTASRTGAAVTSTGDVVAGVVHGTKVQVKETGNTVYISNFMFARTNFFINESRPYVGKHKLTRYLYIPFLQYVYIVGFFVSISSFASTTLAFVMLGLNIFFALIYTQNMYVNLKTMRHVLKQPGVPDHMLSRTNTFLEITLEEFAATYAVSHQAGIGAIVQGTGTVKIQVFQNSAKRLMRICVAVSTICFLASFIMIFYSLAWGIVQIIL